MLIEYKETELYFEDHGQGPAVVLLHGFLETSSFYRSLAEHLKEKYRVISIDLLGHGSSGNVGYIHSMEDMADAVKHITDHLKLRKLIFIGHSMGGYVALAFADLYPDHIRGICLLNSSSRADSPQKKKNRTRAIKAIKENHRSFIIHAIPQLFRFKNRKIFSDQIKTLKKDALRCSKQGIIAAAEGMKIRQDREVILHFAPYPKLIITGRRDGILKLEDQIEQTEQSKTDLDIMPDGHMSLIENQKDVYYSIERFLDKCMHADPRTYL